MSCQRSSDGLVGAWSSLFVAFLDHGKVFRPDPSEVSLASDLAAEEPSASSLGAIRFFELDFDALSDTVTRRISVSDCCKEEP